MSTTERYLAISPETNKLVVDVFEQSVWEERTVNLIIFKSRVDFSLPILYYGSMSNFKRYYQDKNIVFITIVTYNRQQIWLKISNY